jgi:competence protein ComGF
MKKLLTICLIMATLFTVNAQTKTRYAFVTDTEHDKAYDEDDKNGYVNLVSNIVTINCDISNNNIMHQFIAHYSAEEETKTRYAFSEDLQ